MSIFHRRTQATSDDEKFCPTCFAGMESSEHHEVCGEGAHSLIRRQDGTLDCCLCDMTYRGQGVGVMATRKAYAQARRRPCIAFGAW